MRGWRDRGGEGLGEGADVLEMSMRVARFGEIYNTFYCSTVLY